MYLHLLLNKCLCDYRCVFCTMGSSGHVADTTKVLSEFDYAAEWERIESVLRSGAEDPQVAALHIMGNDPSNHPDLVRAVRRARELGFEEVVLETIGVKLADEDFTQALVDAGVTCFKIPIYGNTAAVHDAIVRLPGAYDRLQRALGNVRSHPVTLQHHALILKQNLGELPALLATPAMSFRFPFHHERADFPYAHYAPRLSDVAPEVLAKSDVYVPCIRGAVSHTPRSEVRVRPEDPGHRDEDPHMRTRRPARCTPALCGDFDACRGIYPEYFAVYGEVEFQTRSEAGRSSGEGQTDKPSPTDPQPALASTSADAEARLVFEESLRRARELGPAVVDRGVLQRYFVSPVLPMEPLTPDEIGAAWGRLSAEIKAGRAPELLNLYLHLPFCAHRCRYCVYYSVESREDAAREPYLQRLRAELDFYGAALDGVGFTTLYMGGGTPTVLSETQLAGLLDHIDATIRRKPGGEWAFECNPLSASEAKARLFRDHGFNRVSFGVQTLNPSVLGVVNRGYQTAGRVAETFRIMKDCGFWINVDLIHGLPGETPESMSESLEGLLALGPHQITMYTLSPFTPMPQDVSALEPVRDGVARVEEIARRHGQRVGISPTSIGLYAPEKDTANTLLRQQSKEAGGEGHTYNDLTVEPFSLLGIGPTARSYIYGQLRYMHDRYPVDAPFEPGAQAATGRTVSLDEERRRFVVYSLERKGGVNLADYEELFGEPPQAAFGPELRAALAAGGLTQQGEVLAFGSDDPTQRFATGLLFVEPESIELAQAPQSVSEAEQARKRRAEEEAQKRRAAEEERRRRRAEEEERRGRAQAEAPTVVIRGRGQEVPVVLAEHRPGRPCFHHAGPFAFYIPSDEPEGSCTTGNEHALVLKAFARLFDRVVAQDTPASLAELQQRLVSRLAPDRGE
ncbi:MAG: radical SAM protein [bacterium]